MRSWGRASEVVVIIHSCSAGSGAGARLPGRDLILSLPVDLAVTLALIQRI